MRTTKLFLGIPLACIVVGLGLGVAHYEASRRIRHEVQAWQEQLPPGDVFLYQKLSVGLIGRSVTFTNPRLKYGPYVAAADRVTVRGVGPQSIGAIGADNLRVAQGLDVVAVHHLTVRDTQAPKPFNKMTPADWPLIQFGRLSLRDTQIGFIRNEESGALSIDEFTVRDYGSPTHDYLELHGLELKGNATIPGGARLGRLAADNPNLAATVRWVSEGNINNLGTLHFQRRSGHTDIDNVSVGPVDAAQVSVQHVRMVLTVDPQTSASHSVLDMTDWESRAPQVLAFLTSLGYSDNRFIKADLSLSSDYDPAKQQFRLAPLKLNVAGMASVGVNVTLDQWPALHSMPSPATLLTVQLRSLAVNYQDASLFDHVLGYMARQRGISAGEVQAGLRADVARLGEGGTPAAVEASKALTSFLEKPDILRIGVNPPQPVPLSILALSIGNQSGALQALNVTVKAH